MSTATRAKSKTAPEIIRDRLGEDLVGLYVTPRRPGGFEEYDPFGLVAVVDMEPGEYTPIIGELSTELAQNGHFIPLTAEQKGGADLPEEVMEI